MPPDDHLDGRDVDAEFAAIIAGWDSVPDLPPSLTDDPEADGGPTTRPLGENGEPGPPPSADPARSADPAGPRGAPVAGDHGAPAGPAGLTGPPGPDAPDAPAASVGAGHGAGDGDRGAGPPPSAPREVPPPGIVESGLEEGHFEPRPVQLPPHEDLHFWGIVIGLTVGPLLLLFMAFFGEGHSRWWTYAAFALVIGGFALLVLRQPRRRDDDDHDDGARV